MKFKKATYFSFFFLGCFLLSFSVGTIQSLNSKTKTNKVASNHHLTVSQSDFGSTSTVDFVLEENENETEDEFQLHEFTLPFHFSSYIYDVSISIISNVKPLTLKLVNPIYLSVCSFRI